MVVGGCGRSRCAGRGRRQCWARWPAGGAAKVEQKAGRPDMGDRLPRHYCHDIVAVVAAVDENNSDVETLFADDDAVAVAVAGSDRAAAGLGSGSPGLPRIFCRLGGPPGSGSGQYQAVLAAAASVRAAPPAVN